MRCAFAGLLVAVTLPAHALGDLTAFPMLQRECVRVGGIGYGPQSRWPDCRVTKGRWFATLGFTDLYQGWHQNIHEDGHQVKESVGFA